MQQLNVDNVEASNIPHTDRHLVHAASNYGNISVAGKALGHHSLHQDTHKRQ